MAKQEKIETITINNVEYVRKDQAEPVKLTDRVIIRCRNAGVHVGTIEDVGGCWTKVSNSNRIWRWRGANTLSEVALHGVNREKYTRIAEMLPKLTLNNDDICEIIPVADGVDLTAVWNA